MIPAAELFVFPRTPDEPCPVCYASGFMNPCERIGGQKAVHWGRVRDALLPRFRQMFAEMPPRYGRMFMALCVDYPPDVALKKFQQIVQVLNEE